MIIVTFQDQGATRIHRCSGSTPAQCLEAARVLAKHPGAKVSEVANRVRSDITDLIAAVARRV